MACDEIKPGETPPGEWVKSLFAVVPGCLIDDSGNQVTGYAMLDPSGAFMQWVVLSGNTPVDLTDPASLHPVCGGSDTGNAIDFELVCSSVDGRLLKFNATSGDLTELDGTAITDGSIAVICPSENEIYAGEQCYCDGGVEKIALRVLNPTSNNIRFIDSLSGNDVSALITTECPQC